MRASNAVSKTYGSTIFQRMWRNGHERTRNDTHSDPALAADISDVNDGRVRHFVTELLSVLLCTPPLAPCSPTCRVVSLGLRLRSSLGAVCGGVASGVPRPGGSSTGTCT